MTHSRFLRFCSILVYLMTSALLTAFGQEIPTSLVGDIAPEIRVSAFLGSEVSLPSDKVLVLGFFRPDNYPSSIDEIFGEWDTVRRELPDVQVMVIGASNDPASLPLFWSKNNRQVRFGFAIARDAVKGQGENGEYAETFNEYLGRFGVDRQPVTFVITSDGRVGWIGSPGNALFAARKIVSGAWEPEEVAPWCLHAQAYLRDVYSSRNFSDNAGKRSDGGKLVTVDVAAQYIEVGDAAGALRHLALWADPVHNEREMAPFRDYYTVALEYSRGNADMARRKSIFISETQQDIGRLLAIANLCRDSVWGAGSMEDLAIARSILRKARMICDDVDVRPIYLLAYVEAELGNFAEAVLIGEKAVALADRPNEVRGFRSDVMITVRTQLANYLLEWERRAAHAEVRSEALRDDIVHGSSQQPGSQRIDQAQADYGIDPLFSGTVGWFIPSDAVPRDRLANRLIRLQSLNTVHEGASVEDRVANGVQTHIVKSLLDLLNHREDLVLRLQDLRDQLEGATSEGVRGSRAHASLEHTVAGLAADLQKCNRLYLGSSLLSAADAATSSYVEWGNLSLNGVLSSSGGGVLVRNLFVDFESVLTRIQQVHSSAGKSLSREVAGHFGEAAELCARHLVELNSKDDTAPRLGDEEKLLSDLLLAFRKAETAASQSDSEGVELALKPMRIIFLRGL